MHIKQMLMQNFGYIENNIRVLAEESADLIPTRGNIESSIDWLVHDAREEDTLVFHYSGHGSYIQDNNGDESDGRDELIVPLDYERAGMIFDDWLYKNMVMRVPKGATLWGFSDCCHSGTLFDLKFNFQSACTYKKRRLVPGSQYNHIEWTDKFTQSIENKNSNEVPLGHIVMFSGCQDRETSADANVNGIFQGAFTYCLIETIKNNMERLTNGDFQMKSLSLRNMLKEINCRLDINQFRTQNCQLSVSDSTYFELNFEL
jgi:hypothetical protein